jgi:hypothetical protein
VAPDWISVVLANMLAVTAAILYFQGVLKYRLQEYSCLVRVKTSVTLPKQLLGRLDRLDKNRSAILERVAVAYLARLERDARDRKDIEIIERNAKRLNRQAMVTLKYQRMP